MYNFTKPDGSFSFLWMLQAMSLLQVSGSLGKEIVTLFSLGCHCIVYITGQFYVGLLRVSPAEFNRPYSQVSVYRISTLFRPRNLWNRGWLEHLRFFVLHLGQVQSLSWQFHHKVNSGLALSTAFGAITRKGEGFPNNDSVVSIYSNSCCAKFPFLQNTSSHPRFVYIRGKVFKPAVWM